MKYYNKVVMLLIVSMFFAGCAPTLRVPVMRPAEINLKGINKIALGEIEGNAGQAVSELLSEQLFSSGKFDILDRSNLERIMKEHNLNMSGIIDEKTAATMGKFVGASVMVFGRATGKYELTSKRGKPWKDKEGYTHVAHRKKGVAKVSASLKVVGLTTGKVLAMKNISRTAEDSTSADNEWPEDPDRDTIMSTAMRSVATTFFKMISPHVEHVRVKFATPTTPEGKTGLEYAKQGQWGMAVENFEKAANILQSPAKKSGSALSSYFEKPSEDAMNAYYNLGLAYSFNNEFVEAKRALNKANQIAPCEQCVQQLITIEGMIRDRKVLEEQGAI